MPANIPGVWLVRAGTRQYPVPDAITAESYAAEIAAREPCLVVFRWYDHNRTAHECNWMPGGFQSRILTVSTSATAEDDLEYRRRWN